MTRSCCIRNPAVCSGKHQPGFVGIINEGDIEAQGRMNPHEGTGNEDGFECLFESALEEERSLSKTLSLPNTSRASSNACCGASSLGSSKSGMGVNGSGTYSDSHSHTHRCSGGLGTQNILQAMCNNVLARVKEIYRWALSKLASPCKRTGRGCC